MKSLSQPPQHAPQSASAFFDASAPHWLAAMGPDGMGDGPAQALPRARAFALPLLVGETMHSGENALAHADAVVHILAGIGAAATLQAAVYLVHASFHLNQPAQALTKAFGPQFATLAVETAKLMQVQRQTRQSQGLPPRVDDPAVQIETVRKMLLGFSRDVRVVLLRLASRLQTLRWFAASKTPASQQLAHEALHVFAPLANRLGIWQIKWEMEDLAFRFLEPQAYHDIARNLAEKRAERELYMQQLREKLEGGLKAASISASVQGRPKHIYSIAKKMRGKKLDFHQLFDIRALRVIVPNIKDCYAALSWVHGHFEPIHSEFDDYIARPKPNGYQSLHTVVRDVAGRAIEIQIRTQAMHQHAESGVAAHWAYKEAGTKGYAGVSASSSYDAKIAVLRQLLAWEQDMADEAHAQGLFDDRIYVLTPQAAVIELPAGATPVDFAYSVHTSLGHRCRGAKVDGQMVALNTPLKNGQTIDIVTEREERPSRDWLNPELGYLASSRARAKVRAWFNAQAMQHTIARGREWVEKLLQREGRTALRLQDLATQLGFKTADALFEVVGKEEFSLRNIEAIVRGDAAHSSSGAASGELAAAEGAQNFVTRSKSSAAAAPKAGILVVGVDSLLTQLAKCCKPAPPDAIGGFVTRGRGVSVHRADCANFREIAQRSPERLVHVDWPASAAAATSGASPTSKSSAARAQASAATAVVYPVDISIQASDRQGLQRDIFETFVREKINVTQAHSRTVRDHILMELTVEVHDAHRLGRVLAVLKTITGVKNARRR